MEDLRFTSLWNLRTLSFRTIHSANQLIFYGAVSSWCEDFAQKIAGQKSSRVDQSVSKVNDQLSQKLEPQEVDSLVETPRRIEGAAGHHLCVYLRQFEVLEPEVQDNHIWESAGFIRRVSVGMHRRTSHDLDDGFKDRTEACR